MGTSLLWKPVFLNTLRRNRFVKIYTIQMQPKISFYATLFLSVFFLWFVAAFVRVCVCLCVWGGCGGGGGLGFREGLFLHSSYLWCSSLCLFQFF